MTKKVAVNKSNQSTPYYIGGVDLVDFLLSGNESIRIINQVDVMEVIEKTYIYGNNQPMKSISRFGITYKKNRRERVFGKVLLLKLRIAHVDERKRLIPTPLSKIGCIPGGQGIIIL